ncbi:MAG: DnaA regulatory inactivator Hda, partial [Nevskiales bacterium]
MSTPPDRRPVQLPLGVQLRESASFTTFFAGPNIELLHQLETIATGAGPAAAVHFISGPDGSGKTHLLQAASRAAGERSRSVAYLPLAEFVAAGVGVIEGLAQQSLVCLDDVDAVIGRREWQEALMALCEGLRATGGSLLAVATRPPMELGLELKDLATRLAWGPVYALKPLGDDDKIRLLQQRARGRGLELPEEVGRYLLTRGAREIPALLSVLERLDNASLAAQRRLTVP